MYNFSEVLYIIRGCMGSWQTRAYKPILWNNLLGRELRGATMHTPPQHEISYNDS